MSYQLYFCTLDDCVSYYLVSAEHPSHCFDVIDRSEQIRAVGAYPTALGVVPAQPIHLEVHRMTDDTGSPLDLSALASTLIISEVLWSSEW